MHKRLQLNYWAVLVIGLNAFFLSILWYSPIAFGPVWEKYRNVPNPGIPHWTLVFAPLRELIASLVVSILIIRLHLTHWTAAAKLMAVLWFAFHAVVWPAQFFGTTCPGHWVPYMPGTGL